MEFALPPPALLIFLGMFLAIGLASGRVLEDVTYRLPRLNATRRREDARRIPPRAHCRTCSAPLPLRQRLPVVAYVALGQCRSCQAPLERRRLAMEVLTAGIFVVAAWQLGPTWQLVGAVVFLWFAIPLAVIDLDVRLLPEDLTAGLLWSGLLANVAGLFAPLEEAVLGAAAAYISMRAAAEMIQRRTGKEALGLGDAKLLAALGAWLGWQDLFLVGFIASALAALILGTQVITHRRTASEPFAFGPFLLFGGLVALLWGPLIWHVAMGLVRP